MGHQSDSAVHVARRSASPVRIMTHVQWKERPGNGTLDLFWNHSFSPGEFLLIRGWGGITE